MLLFGLPFELMLPKLLELLTEDDHALLADKRAWPPLPATR